MKIWFTQTENQIANDITIPSEVDPILDSYNVVRKIIAVAQYLVYVPSGTEVR